MAEQITAMKDGRYSFSYPKAGLVAGQNLQFEFALDGTNDGTYPEIFKEIVLVS